MFAAGKPPRGAGGRPPRRGEQIKPYGSDLPVYGGGRGPVMPGKPAPQITPYGAGPRIMPAMQNVRGIGGGGGLGGMGMKKGGKVKSASSRADGCAMRGKTKGKIV